MRRDSIRFRIAALMTAMAVVPLAVVTGIAAGIAARGSEKAAIETTGSRMLWAAQSLEE